MVRKGRDLRSGERRASDGWKVGARRNWKGVRGMGIECGDEEGREGVGKTQPRAWRRSAEPEDEVDALLPCYTCKNRYYDSQIKHTTHLTHSRPRPSSNDRGRRADIERVIPVSAGPYNVDYKIVLCACD